ncbi:Uncharacterized conserved protein, DUF924 family [Shimia gijangensis]|uniref:Uncharacterized conserved protein, DUF924 family n=1 Tax=Shimia gijangensis TaxID=1470563 RepID=A0A1M6GZB5_9RHOB|nr:DUF924 family protein [Shimia gijangensis]SHJ15319.1 Uncharacterized conserved protein, DUF924 family [Shimia gijangensis]
MPTTSFEPQDVLDLWFPDNGHQNSLETHGAFWDERMQGGMDARIVADFSDLTLAAATGQLDHWAKTAKGRLALLIALDQFPRSLWRDTPAAFAQDIKAARLAIEGLKNGDFEQLEPWEQAFFVISISHCEGPDHLQRMEMLCSVVDRIAKRLTGPLEQMRSGFKDQHNTVFEVLKRFGRHPHRNPILGRPSTPEEEAYIATGDFPHVRSIEDISAST